MHSFFLVTKLLLLQTLIRGSTGFVPSSLTSTGKHHHHNPLASSFIESDQDSNSDMLSYPSGFSSRNSQVSSSTTSSSSPPPSFLLDHFMSSSSSALSSSLGSECDDVNRPPSLNILLNSLHQLTQGLTSTDIRGRFVDHKRLGSVASVAHEIGRQSPGPQASLTPFATYCLGYGLAHVLLQQKELDNNNNDKDNDNEPLRLVIGQDPRPHGTRLADALARGAESVPGVQVLYTGLASTPACAAFCRLHDGTDGAVMITASHLPIDRNGLKMFDGRGACLTLSQISNVGQYAAQCAQQWYTRGMLPPASGDQAVQCHAWVDYMPAYVNSLKQAIQQQLPAAQQEEEDAATAKSNNCLQGLNIVLNAGHGSGYFFRSVLSDLGANMQGSLGTEPDSTFPLGIPNPEYKPMIQATVEACQEVGADLGIMLDTDSDRCGFVVPQTSSDGTVDYEPLNRNRLIAIMGVILSQTHPGCGVVTDSVTSEGLTTFLQDTLGLQHIRHVKGYQAVIDRAKEITESGAINVELAMETSGHGAMRENQYLDDGTYTALKVVGLLAQQKAQKQSASLLDLIQDLEELDVVEELRFQVLDESLESMRQLFDFCALEIERLASEQHDQVPTWEVDVDNLEGIRIRVGDGQFFMLRKSLHDPIISLQIEARSRSVAQDLIVKPLLRLFESEERIVSELNFEALVSF